MTELVIGAQPPPLRPHWARAGWMARAVRWIDEELRRRGRQRTGPADLWRLWSLSAMLRIPTDAGEAWFKAVFPNFHHEPAVTSLLASWAPDLLPSVLGSEPHEGWLLMASAGTEIPDGPEADTPILAAIERLAWLQELTVDRLPELTAVGCPHRSLAGLADDLVDALAGWETLGGNPVRAGRAARVASWVRKRAMWLDGVGMPEVLLHGDFHPGNVLVGGKGMRIIDWSDAAVAHPALDVGPWFGEVAPEMRPAGWRAWLTALRRFGPVDEFREQEPIVHALACAYQVVSYAGILRGVEPANRYKLADSLNGYWGDLEARVP